MIGVAAGMIGVAGAGGSATAGGGGSAPAGGGGSATTGGGVATAGFLPFFLAWVFSEGKKRCKDQRHTT